MTDFVQAKTNPGGTFISPADAVPAAMEDFALPYGVSNPTHDSIPGYRGTELGTDCATDLYQIGGGQNTTGTAGTTMGTDIYVETNVGVGAAVELASGSFPAPSARGIHIYVLQNAEANIVLNALEPGEAWTVFEADVSYDPVGFRIIVCPGDVDGSASVDMTDLQRVLASYGSTQGDPGPPEYDAACDFDRDGDVDLTDLQTVLNNYDSTCD